MKKLKTFLSLYFAVLSFLIGYGVAKSRDLSPLDMSLLSYLWPLISALFFTFSILLFWIFINRARRK